MAVSYKKLWKLLIDKDMKKKDLCAAAGISHASMAKLGKNENITTDVLVKICTALQCDIGDIMELTKDVILRRDYMSINRDKPDLWKNDILQSVDLYNSGLWNLLPGHLEKHV